jgi:protein-disulfide isomerase
MTGQWKIGALGALSGAAIAVVIVFGAALFGAFPRAPAAFDGRQVRAYLLKHPDILVDMSNALQDQQAADEDKVQQDALRAIGLAAFFDPKVAFVTGPADAKATIVELFDYNCVHCRNTFPALKKYYEAHKNDTRFAFVDFPIFGKMSDTAALAAIAARRQPGKYLAFSFGMMSQKTAITQELMMSVAASAGIDIAKLTADMDLPEVKATLAKAQELGRKLKVTGTPTFIYNGRVRAGEVTDAQMKDIMAGKAT